MGSNEPISLERGIGMFIVLDKNSAIPLKKQLYDVITEKILSGELAKGDKLPSTRDLAAKLGIARNTVVEIYEQLISEAYLETVYGKGTFVAGTKETIRVRDPLPVSREQNKRKKTDGSHLIRFECGVPDLKEFPQKAWLRALRESIETSDEVLYGYGSVFGYRPLREALAHHLMKYKGIRCSPGQIVIVNGTSDALNLIAMLFRQDVEEVIIESVIANFIPDIFRAYGYKLRPVKVDPHGLCTKDLPETDNGIIFTSPSHQFPLGSTMSIERRLQLADYAITRRHYVIEDDFDSEFRYAGAPVNSVYQLAPENVIHLGTFSKTLAPFLWLGYMVVPQKLASRVHKLQTLLGRRVNMHDQMALHYLLKQGVYMKHIILMCKLYKRKMRCITNALREQFGDNIQILGTHSGMHIAVVFSGKCFHAASTRSFLKHGVGADLLLDYMIEKQETCDTLILGFGNLDENAIREGVKRLKAAISM